MSRRTSKQRRSAAWRREWCARWREWIGDPVVGWLTDLMADYSEELQRSEPPVGLGRRWPVPPGSGRGR